jgi:hypothetical protein
MAIALVSKAELLVLDEPTAALDGAGSRRRRRAAHRDQARGTHHSRDAQQHDKRRTLGIADAPFRYPDSRDIEVRGAGLEEAFLDLTGADRTDGATW